MKKFIKSLLAVTLGASLLVACSSDDSTSDEVLTIGATSSPHAEILNYVADDLAEEGITLDIIEFTDYTLINSSTADGSVDANYFQHTAYLNDYNANNDDTLVSVGPVHVEPMGVYSNAITSLDELSEGDKVSIPNDASNEARALKLLEDNSLITLDDSKTENLTPLDVIDNPMNLEFVELDAAQLPRTMDEVTISVINTNYALEGGMNPIDDALVMEGNDSPYANILVTTEENADNAAILALYDALTSEDTQNYILDTYEGAVVPVSN